MIIIIIIKEASMEQGALFSSYSFTWHSDRVTIVFAH
jgi:hypothetical protein